MQILNFGWKANSVLCGSVAYLCDIMSDERERDSASLVPFYSNIAAKNNPRMLSFKYPLIDTPLAWVIYSKLSGLLFWPVKLERVSCSISNQISNAAVAICTGVIQSQGSKSQLKKDPFVNKGLEVELEQTS